MTLHRQGRLVEAEEFYQRILDLDPRQLQALRLAGVLARERGELSKSLKRLTRLAEIADDDPSSLSELALTHMMAGHLRRADAYFRQALARDANCYKAMANLGALLQRRGHLIEAIGLYRRCLDLESGDLEIRCNLASALMEAGQGDEALAECDAALSVSPGHPVLLANQGGVLCGLEEFEPAIQVLERVASSGFADEMAMINLGFAHSRLGNVEAAIDVLSAAASAYPDNARAFADLANAWVAAGEFDKAAECCELFLARYPGERLVLANYAYALRDAGRVDEADAILDFPRLIAMQDIEGRPGYESLASFNQALSAQIESHSSLLADPVRKATTGGQQTGELDFTDGVEFTIFEELVNGVVRATVQKYRDTGLSDHPAMACAQENWTLRVWATVLHSGGHQTPHLHPMAWLSGVYYVQLPTDLGSTGGLEFGPPPSHLVVNSAPDEYAVAVQEGRLVLFPSYFYHRTKPFVSKQRRISLAFDVVPEPPSS